MKTIFCIAIAALGTLCIDFCPAVGEDEIIPPVSVRAIAFSADGKHLAVGFGAKEVPGGVVLWNIEKRAVAHVLRQERGVSTLAFSSDGKLLAISVYDSGPKVLRADTLQVEAELEGSCRGPVAFSADGRTLASGCVDRTVRLWDVSRRSNTLVLTGHKEPVHTAAFSPDGKTLVTAARDGGLVWNLESGEQKFPLKHGSSLTSCAIFPGDGQWILTGGWDGTVGVWSAADGQLRGRFRRLAGVDRLAFSSEAGLLAVCSGSRQIQFFEFSLEVPSAADAAKIDALLVRLDDDDYAVREAASADLVKLGFRAEPALRRAAAESSSAEVRIRARVASKALYSEPQAVLSEHQDQVRCIAFSPSGEFFASGGDDGTARLWGVRNRAQLAVFDPSTAAAAP